MDNLARGDAFFAKQMADDAETENTALSIRFVDERDYKEVSLPRPSGRRCWKKNRPSWFHLRRGGGGRVTPEFTGIECDLRKK